MYNGWIDLNVRATLKDWEQVVHSLFECSFFLLFFLKKIVDSQSSLPMKTQRVLKIEEIPWFHPKSITSSLQLQWWRWDHSPYCHLPFFYLSPYEIKGKSQKKWAVVTRGHLFINPHSSFHATNRLEVEQHEERENKYQIWVDVDPHPQPECIAVRDTLLYQQL